MHTCVYLYVYFINHKVNQTGSTVTVNHYYHGNIFLEDSFLSYGKTIYNGIVYGFKIYELISFLATKMYIKSYYFVNVWIYL